MQNSKGSFILGVALVASMFVLGYVLGGSIVKFKTLERTVTVKGLSEREVMADTVLWPIVYIEVENELPLLYAKLEKNKHMIMEFLKEKGFEEGEVSTSAPSIVDKIAQDYGGANKVAYRYNATQTITLYTKKVGEVRKVMNEIASLGKSGVTFQNNSYDNPTEYIFTQLNEIKPSMIEEATQSARSAALKFAEDSQSVLGKIKSANQGQFSISPRDRFTPHVKNVRVVSTIEYYLND